MAISTVVTRGFGNGTFTGTIALVVTRGYLGIVFNLIDNDDVALGAILNSISAASAANLIDNNDTPTAVTLSNSGGGSAGNLTDNDNTPTAATLIDVT